MRGLVLAAIVLLAFACNGGGERAWSCFDVGIYEHAICQLPEGALVLDSLGEVLATSEKAYPNCPDSWSPIDAERLCLPPTGWSYAAAEPGVVTSAAGSRVFISEGLAHPCPEMRDPVHTLGLVLRPQPLKPDTWWCLRVGQRLATISVPADAPMDEYYAAFQVALSAAHSTATR